MAETFVGRIPSDEDINAVYRGFTWPEFKELSDEEVGVLFQERRVEAVASLRERSFKLQKPIDNNTVAEESLDEDAWKDLEESIVFSYFVDWRKHGIPDRNMTYDELMERVEDSVKLRIASDSNFGELTPEQYQDLPTQDRKSISYLLQYFYEMRDPFEYMRIDDYSLFSTIGLEEKDVEGLQRNQVLRHVGVHVMVGNVYALTDPYYNFYLVQVFTGQET